MNSTAAVVALSSWHSGGCPIQSFAVRFRPENSKKWLLAEERRNPDPKDYVLLSPLTPGVRYYLQVTAHNQAGTTEAEYMFQTSAHGPETPPATAIEGSNTVLMDLNIILPIIVALVVVISVIVVVCIVMRRKQWIDGDTSAVSSAYDCNKEPAPEAMQLADIGNSSLKKLPLPHEPMYYPTPYATTQMEGDKNNRIQNGRYQEEPLYATVKRTPRPPRSDVHIYHYPLVAAEAEPGDDLQCSPSHWRRSSVPLEEIVENTNRKCSPCRTNSAGRHHYHYHTGRSCHR